MPSRVHTSTTVQYHDRAHFAPMSKSAEIQSCALGGVPRLCCASAFHWLGRVTRLVLATGWCVATGLDWNWVVMATLRLCHSCLRQKAVIGSGHVRASFNL
jgi:hypothetical protein